MRYVGDFNPGASVGGKFNTHQADGTPITLGGTPAVKVYKKGSAAESAAGVTLTVDYDSVTGLHDVVIDTSADGAFYAAGNDYSAVITAGTVGGTSVAGTTVFGFSIENRNIKANLVQSLGVAVTNYDGTLAAVTADTDVTFPMTDAAGNSVPDDARYEYAVLRLTGGTGAGQLMYLTAKAGTRKFGFVDAATPVNPSTDTTYEVLGGWRGLLFDATAAAANKLADHARRRKQSNVEVSADGDALDDARSQYGAIQQVQQSNTTAHAGKLTVFQTDGTTELEQLTLATSASADAVTGIS